MPSLHEQIAAGRQALVAAGFCAETAALDAEVLARHVLGWDRARLLAHDREPPSREFAEQFQAAVARRVRREPVALITGHREFWGLDFRVTSATLVPRPESEMIVEEALRLLPYDAHCTVLDIGTGSGCLGVSIAHDRPRARGIATDISHDALLVARQNAGSHGVADRITFLRTDLAAGLRLCADLIVSNPPYVPERPAAALPVDVVRYEPANALFGGPDGLAVIRRLFATVGEHLAPGGTLIVEFGFGQEDEVREAAEREGWHVLRILHDLQGIARTIVARRSRD